MKKIIFYVFLSLSICLDAQQELKNIDSTLDSIFGHYNNNTRGMPGVSIAILEKNKPTVFKSYGFANLEYGVKNTSNTLFNATDLAKQFTVFSILMLQDKGELSVDDDIKKYIPLLKEWPFRITLKHLMEQTSGLRDVMDLKKWIGYKNGDVITKQDILETAAKQRYLNFPSGSKFEYNRTGFVLLTEVIENLSGMLFAEFVDRHIFTPLKMNNSVFINTHTELIPNRAYSYATKDNKFIKIANNSSFMGGTNLYTSTSDFSKWLQNMSNQSIGKPSFYDYMQSNIILSDGQKSNYTPGIFRDNTNGYSTIHLEGFDHGYTSYMMYLPKYDFSLVFFSNDIDFPISDIFKPFYNWFNSSYNIPPIKIFEPQSVKLVYKSTNELRNYTGNYLFEDNFSLREIVLENDTLYYTRDENNRNKLIAIEGDDTFKMLFPGNDNIRVTFKNQRDILEFRSINSGNGNDYVTIGRKFKFSNEKQKAFTGEFMNEALDHTIIMQNKNEKMQLIIGSITIVLDQIGDNEFLAQPNLKVKYVKVQRDEHQNIIGVYLSNGKIKNLYYKIVNE